MRRIERDDAGSLPCLTNGGKGECRNFEGIAAAKDPAENDRLRGVNVDAHGLTLAARGGHERDIDLIGRDAVERSDLQGGGRHVVFGLAIGIAQGTRKGRHVGNALIVRPGDQPHAIFDGQRGKADQDRQDQRGEDDKIAALIDKKALQGS